MATRKTTKTSQSFSDDEIEAMKDKVAEEKAEKAARRKGGKKVDGEADLLAKVAELNGLDRELAEGLHALVKEHAPSLAPKTWYGMPAWAGEDGKAVCFFTPGEKFKERYASLGFNTSAKLDDGNMWPTSFALLKLGDAEKKQIAALLKKAVG
ncbi:DUF1801 domain-containing protein [Devosia ginsengisoli]|uniref:DUF1801 domain-containing protein n=1 Tax=Devosia ginsengisoli TaxID=400770 RepID=UPI0026EA1090|nr:DUF1801 domain-containing protein [Devosia ginsengisoli]MCR6670833.1 DUF1801 domain-containing protein [Devosia ginsengisoli]